MSQHTPDQAESEKKPLPPTAADAPDGEEGELESSKPLLFQYIPSWLTSFVLHVTVVVLLALIPILVQEKETVNLVAGDAGPPIETPSEINLDPLEGIPDALEQQTAIDVDNPVLQPMVEAPQFETPSEDTSLSELLNPADVGLEASGEALSAAISGGSELVGRAAAGSSAAARASGATGLTEECVALGLQWLAAHQLPDGSWNFNHQAGPGDRSSPDPGVFEDCPIGATAMCLMAFLGNGQTHREGAYKEQVGRALNYLVSSQRRGKGFSGSLVDPNYYGGPYGHAMAAIALAEAYGMTKDPMLYEPAQAALDYIEYAQNRSGGWRYTAKMPGDLSVSGWMFMAVKSGLMSDLNIAKGLSKKFERFLDSVSYDSGAKYYYQEQIDRDNPAMIAVGLLCRMYLGWKKNNSTLERGIAYLAKVGPKIEESTDMYYNYYATQVLHHYGGEDWKNWNKVMSEYLVKSQSRVGATKGSWFFDRGTDRGVAAGGRVYCTCLAVMTLEVYYRFLPLYRDAALKDEFPLE